MIMTTEAQFRE